VLKRAASLYHPGRRTREWLKIRNIRAAELRVGGWLPGTDARAHLAGSVLMGLPGRARWRLRARSAAACRWQTHAS
jgi:bifunctional non-homologous end joining protein LigD